MKIVAFGNGRTLTKQILETIKENTMNSVTTIYKVYGCGEEGEPRLRAEFLDLKEACQYAVANHGKIHYGLPNVDQVTYVYDPEFKVVHSSTIQIEPTRIHYMNKI